MGSTVMSVIDVLGADRVQGMVEKLMLKTERDLRQLALGAFRNKVGDPYLDLQWVLEEFLAQSGPILMLTTLGMPWLYASARACLRRGPHVMPLVGVGTFVYVAQGGHSSWLFAWPISEQVKLWVAMDKIADYLAKFTLPDMLAFVKKGFHVVLAARRVVWVPYGYNVAMVSPNTELEDAGFDSRSHVLAMPMLSDTMASRGLSLEVLQMLVETVSAMRKSPDAQTGIWAKVGPIYQEWLRSFMGNGEDEDGHEDSLRQEETAKLVKSTDEPAMSDKLV